MKLNRICAIGAVMCAMALAACGAVSLPSLPTSGASPPIVSTRDTIRDEQALYAAEAAYNVAASAYVSADSRGLLTDAVKARARPVLVRAYEALTAARTAYRAGDSPTFAAQAREVMTLASQARALTPG